MTDPKQLVSVVDKCKIQINHSNNNNNISKVCKISQKCLRLLIIIVNY